MFVCFLFGELYVWGQWTVHSDCEREIETEIDRISEKDRDRETQKTDWYKRLKRTRQISRLKYLNKTENYNAVYYNVGFSFSSSFLHLII